MDGANGQPSTYNQHHLSHANSAQHLHSSQQDPNQMFSYAHQIQHIMFAQDALKNSQQPPLHNNGTTRLVDEYVRGGADASAGSHSMGGGNPWG